MYTSQSSVKAISVQYTYARISRVCLYICRCIATEVCTRVCSLLQRFTIIVNCGEIVLKVIIYVKIWNDFQKVQGIPFLAAPFTFAFVLNIDWFQLYKHILLVLCTSQYSIFLATSVTSVKI